MSRNCRNEAAAGRENLASLILFELGLMRKFWEVVKSDLVKSQSWKRVFERSQFSKVACLRSVC